MNIGNQTHMKGLLQQHKLTKNPNVQLQHYRYNQVLLHPGLTESKTDPRRVLLMPHPHSNYSWHHPSVPPWQNLFEVIKMLLNFLIAFERDIKAIKHSRHL